MARNTHADFGLKLESFKTGRDGGIDFRYARAGVKLIVQCKHYLRTGLPGLLRDLRKEVANVRTLSPTRYILVTSVALSPQNKDEIIAAIGADVLQTADVFGQNDLNAALGRHEKIEQRHYKLWLSSRAVLDRVLHNAVITKSDFKGHLYVGFWPHRGKQHLYLAAENRTFNSARTGSIY